MPKGGAERTQASLTHGGARATQLGENFRTGVLEPQLRQFRDFYMDSVPRQLGDYSTTMQGYQDFAKTGGISPMDASNMRARALSPTRAVYDRAMQGVSRQQALQGGYSPGADVIRARMARELGTSLSDTSRATEADIMQMRNQGKLAGLGGAASLYGTTPGQVSMFGNQMLNATNQLGAHTANEMQLPLDIARLQAIQGQMPGKWQQGWQNVMGGIQDVAGMIYPWMGGGTTGLIPSSQSPMMGNINSGIYNPQPYAGPSRNY